MCIHTLAVSKLSKLEAPGKTLSGRKYVASAAGRWSPLVTVRPRNALASALAGQTAWSSPEVDRELKRSQESNKVLNATVQRLSRFLTRISHVRGRQL